MQLGMRLKHETHKPDDTYHVFMHLFFQAIRVISSGGTHPVQAADSPTALLSHVAVRCLVPEGA